MEHQRPWTGFRSVLFPDADDPALAEREPEYFADLGLDQVVEAITRDFHDYSLEAYFRTPLTDLDAVDYRQRVFRDLDDDLVHDVFLGFAAEFRIVRAVSETARGVHDDWQRRFWLLNDHRRYQEAVMSLADRLLTLPLASPALCGFRDHLTEYVRSPTFRKTVGERAAVENALDAVRYCVRLDGLKVTVAPYDDEPDYTAEVEATFEKFRQGSAKTHLVEFGDDYGLNHVETRILALVAELNPDAFALLRSYTDEHADFVDPIIERFEREIHFYLAHRSYMRRLTDHGLPVCYPKIDRTKRVHVTAAYDLALAHKLLDESRTIVPNDIELDGDERVLVVTGANQGGKTTFDRAFGQLHHLAALGCPVPGRDAALFLPDRIFTHFEKEEDPQRMRSKLEDALTRMRDTLERLTSASIVILNEPFTSTTADDALLLGTTVLRELIERDVLCVCVTFVDELSTLSDATVSMVAGVDPADPARRTYVIERRPADGAAHAVAIARKYRLTREELAERIDRESTPALP